MTHQEEHNEIAEALQDASAAAQAIYEDYHNGDKKLNKQIMQIRDTTSKARTLMRSHQKRTANDDWKVNMVSIGLLGW